MEHGISVQIFRSREEWLKARKNTIGGSDAAAVLGVNPWMTNVDLWELKTGQKEQKDVSNVPVVQYGTRAEAPLRELFKLDHPELNVMYEENNLWSNPRYPFAHYSADGWVYDKYTARSGILEIKTAEMLGKSSWLKWEDGIPQNYLCQICQGLAVTVKDFAILKAQLKYWKDDRLFITTREYRYEREDLADDIEYLMTAEEQLWEGIQSGKRPPLILPQI